MDNVNHPAHYESSTSIECIEAMELMFGPKAVYNFCVCNALKYIWRFKNKNGLEDLDKAGWYLDKAKELTDTFELDVASFDEQEIVLRLIELRDQKEDSWRESH